MVRDKHRDKQHFLSYINKKNESHKKRVEKLKQGKIKPERLIPVQQDMASNLISKLVAKYSCGLSIDTFTEDFGTILELIESSWIDGSRKFVGARNTVLDQYNIDPHTQLLRILSIGLLIRFSDDFFERIGEIVREDNVIDTVFEFLLSSKLSAWEMRDETSDYAFKLYQNLKKAIQEPNNEEAEKLIKKFLEKDWLKEQKKAQMLTDVDKDWYYGRWSFESAAIVAIKGLDDSSFKENEYYPKDLVDYYRANTV